MKEQLNNKDLVISKRNDSPNYLMAEGEYVNIIVNAKQSNSEYVISEGIMQPGSFVPKHYHKWEDQTFHIIEGEFEAEIGDASYTLTAGDTIHCPRNISHYMKNISEKPARVISYIFPGDWAEDYFAETSKQNNSGEFNLSLVEEKYGVIYL